MGCSSSKIPEVEKGGEHSFEERNEKEEHNQVIDSTVLDKSKVSVLLVCNERIQRYLLRMMIIQAL